MAYTLQNIGVNIVDQGRVFSKMRKLGLDPMLGRKFNELESTMKREITQIYEQSFKSTVPIRKSINRGRDGKLYARLTIDQKSKLQSLANAGASIDKVLETLTSSNKLIETNFYGGSLRKSITSNLSSIRSGTPGRVFIPDGMHSPPYRTSELLSLEQLALELEAGISKHGTPYRRSRQSEAAGGFAAIGANTPTANWMEAARVQAGPLVQGYVISKARTLFDFSQGRSVNAVRAAQFKAGQNEIVSPVTPSSRSIEDFALRNAIKDQYKPYQQQGGVNLEDLFGAG